MYLAITDLETGGLRADTSAILEINVRIVDAKTLKEHATFHAFPALPAKKGYHSVEDYLDDFCFRTHTLNGLLARREACGVGMWGPGIVYASDDALPPLGHVERTLVEFLRRFHGEQGPRDVLLTGNSLANLDIPFLREHMPSVLGALHYRIYDVSVVRTHYREILQQELPPDIEAQVTGVGKLETHRAADDTLVCLRTIRQMRAWAGSAFPHLNVNPLAHGWTASWDDPADASVPSPRRPLAADDPFLRMLEAAGIDADQVKP